MFPFLALPSLAHKFPNADSLFLSLVDLSPSLVPDQAPVGAHAALAHAVKPAAPRAGRERGVQTPRSRRHPLAPLPRLGDGHEPPRGPAACGRAGSAATQRGGALEGEDDVPGSVPASVSSAYGYPLLVRGGYSGGGRSEYGSAGWRGCVSVQSATPATRPAPFRGVRGYAARSLPPPSASPPTLPVAHTSGGALEGEDDVPGSVSSAEYGSAGWRGMRQCTIAYTSDPPRGIEHAACLPPSASPPDSPRRPHELTVRPALSPRRFEGRVGSSRRECPPFALGSAWRSASPVVSSYARAPTSAPPHTPSTQDRNVPLHIPVFSSHSNLPLPQLSSPFSFWVSPSQYTIITKSADTHAEARARALNRGGMETVQVLSQNDGAVVTEYVKEC
ncbi:hypothetical protein B0H14DRAFT_3727422 [Mycena olivaceomarginata]|nr:hypothetical protein B0H14DRAFT_3727422 [Mycena olivaceomarginata]